MSFIPPEFSFDPRTTNYNAVYEQSVTFWEKINTSLPDILDKLERLAFRVFLCTLQAHKYSEQGPDFFQRGLPLFQQARNDLIDALTLSETRVKTVETFHSFFQNASRFITQNCIPTNDTPKVLALKNIACFSESVHALVKEQFSKATTDLVKLCWILDENKGKELTLFQSALLQIRTYTPTKASLPPEPTPVPHHLIHTSDSTSDFVFIEPEDLEPPKTASSLADLEIPLLPPYPQMVVPALHLPYSSTTSQKSFYTAISSYLKHYHPILLQNCDALASAIIRTRLINKVTLFLPNLTREVCQYDFPLATLQDFFRTVVAAETFYKDPIQASSLSEKQLFDLSCSAIKFKVITELFEKYIELYKKEIQTLPEA